MFGKVRLWFHRRLMYNLRDDAVKKLQETATLLIKIREYNPEMSDRVNEILDFGVYPTIHGIAGWRKEEDLCPTSKKNVEQKSTPTLVK